MHMWEWGADEAQQEQDERMEANRRYEDAMQVPGDSIRDFDQSLSLADAFILHALGVRVALYSEIATL
jgi:hypothetical protein